jgi:hypothetical protein
MSATLVPAKTETVSLIETPTGFEAVCPHCREVIFKSHDRRAALWNSGKIAKHIAACLAD